MQILQAKLDALPVWLRDRLDKNEHDRQFQKSFAAFVRWLGECSMVYLYPCPILWEVWDPQLETLNYAQ